MNDTPRGFRDKLIATEPVNHDLQKKYEKEIEKMFIEEIKGMKKLGNFIVGIFFMLFGASLITSSLFNVPFPCPLPPEHHFLWILSGLFTFGIALMTFIIALKGKTNLRKDSNLLARYGFVGMFVIANLLLLVGFLSGNIKDLTIIAPMSMLLIIIGLLIFIENRVKQGELNTRENLLEIKYTLAKLEERLGDGK